jgi:predicted choloylglycine hydrolase
MGIERVMNEDGLCNITTMGGGNREPRDFDGMIISYICEETIKILTIPEARLCRSL